MSYVHVLKVISSFVFTGAVLSAAGCLGAEPEEVADTRSSVEEPGSDSAALTSPDPGCIPGRLGGRSSCESLESFKQAASDACDAEGLLLSDLRVEEKCGDDVFRGALFACCPPAIEPPPEPACATRTLGGPKSCLDASSWKDAAASFCAGAGMELADLDFAGECGDDGYESVKLECCP